MRKKQVRTSVLIDSDEHPLDDLEFIKSRRLKPTNLLRAKIKELREIEDGKPDIEILLRNIESLQNQIKEIFKFIDEKGLFQEFINRQKI